MFRKMKRFLSIFLAVLMLVTTIPADIFAAEISDNYLQPVELEESIQEEVLQEEIVQKEIVQEEFDQEDLNTENSSLPEEEILEEPIIEETEENIESDNLPVEEELPAEEESIIETIEEIIENDTLDFQENLTESAQKVIGFTPLSPAASEFHVVKAGKPALEQLLAAFPKTLEVTLENEQVENMEVSWECVGEDYDESEAYYFQFSPVWDESKYTVEDGFDVITDAPYISIFFYDEEMVAEAAVTSNSNEEIIFEFLVEEMNLNAAAASGVLANIQHESGFNHKAKGDNGTSYGICQWHNSRWTAMKNYCNNNGYDWTSLKGQLKYLKFELSQNNSKYLWNGKTIYNYLLSVPNNAQGAYDAAYYWCVKFEVPANKETKGKTRGNLAKNTYWPEYKDYYEITAPKLSISDKSDPISVENDFSLTWSKSEGDFEKYKLYIAKKIDGSSKYDWSNAKVYSYSKSTREHKISKMSLESGSYGAYAVAYKNSKKQSDKSNYIYFNIYLPIEFEENTATDILYYDATIQGALNNLEERVLSSVGFYLTKKGGETQKFETALEVADARVEFQYLLSEYAGELDQLTTYTVQFYAVTNELEYKSKKLDFRTAYDPAVNFWVEDIPDQIYEGKGLKPTPNVYDGEKLLVKDVDYTLSYKNNTKVYTGEPKSTAPYVTVIGKGNYSGSGKVYFKIIPKDINTEEILVAQILVAANKKTQKVAPKVTFNGKTLKNKTDYTLVYPDTDIVDEEGNKTAAYKDPGTYQIVINGKGNFTGSKTVTMTITDSKLISKTTISKVKDQKYCAEAIEPELTVKNGKVKLEKDVDYQVFYENNVEIGTAKATIVGIGNYTGEKSITFKIVGGSISKAKVIGLKSSKDYTGSEIFQECTLTMSVNKKPVIALKEGPDKDYVVSYEKNINAGTATIKFTGVNGYSGTLKKTFKINAYNMTKDPLSLITVEEGLNIEYAKGGAKAKPEVKFGDQILTEGVDYKLTYKNHTAVNDGSNPKKLPTVTVTGKGNFKGSRSVTYTIHEKAMDNLELKVSDKAYSKSSNGWKASVTVTDLDGKKLTSGKDYKAVYLFGEKVLSSKDIVPAGSVIRVVAEGMKNYQGQLIGEYKIVSKSISGASVKVKTQYYTGEEICPGKEELTVTVGKTKLSPENYNIVSYTNNIKKGTAKMVLEGVGNYGGRKTVEFKIQARTLKWWWTL